MTPEEEQILELKKENDELKKTVDEYKDLIKELRIDIEARDRCLTKIKEEVDWIL